MDEFHNEVPRSIDDFKPVFNRGIRIEFRDMIMQGIMGENPKLWSPGEPRFLVYLYTSEHHSVYEDLKAQNQLDEIKRTLLHELLHCWVWQNGYHQPINDDGDRGDMPEYSRHIEVWAKSFLDAGHFDKLFTLFLNYPKCSIIFECAKTLFFEYWIKSTGGHVCYDNDFTAA